MIKYKTFKYIFFRYCIYNLLYSIILMFVPILFYIIVITRISSRIENQNIVKLNEIIVLGFNNLKDYTVLFQYRDNIDNILIIIFCILCIFCYIYVKTYIISKLLVKKYNKIIIFVKTKYVSKFDIILFSFIDCLLLSSSFLYIIFRNEVSYIISHLKYFYTIQTIHYLILCIFIYLLLNKFLEKYIRVSFKKLKT